MMKRALAILMTTALAIPVLTACSESVSKDQAKPAEEITLKVFDAHAYGLEEYAEMAKKFEEAHPGVKIEVQHAANDSSTLLQSRVNSGDIPDVFDVESGTAAQKYYEYAYNWSEDKEVLGKFKEAALETGKDGDGNIMSLPWTYENLGLIYNIELFEKAGITELPDTMDELEAACEKLSAAGITPFALAAKETWVLHHLSTHFMMDKSLDAKGVADKLNSGDLAFKDMKNFQNLFRLLDLAVKYGPDKPLEVDWETSENMLANGEAAMIHMGDWCQSTLDSFNPDARLAFLPCPVSDNPEDATLLSSCNWTYIVNKDSKHLDLAKEYLEYILTSEEGQKWMCDGVGGVPGAKTTMEVKGALANDASAYVENGKTNGWIHTIAPTGYSDIVGPAMQAYMIGDMTAQQVTEEFQKGWQIQKN
ncbi:ABC transporter substrate-binding protein [Lacrimispora celerecrescens]|uniref:ABC transporter substrate-binding protein n=1 Tax=Lacrimispora celerecrescens TaxID=29354 RepID=UPI00164758E7|nr:extracellular solute-binding protein [Lacrimispora celerecrescens]